MQTLKKAIALVLTMAMMLSVFAVSASAVATSVNVSSGDELKTALNDPYVMEITLTGDISMTGNWEPVALASGRRLTINGGGHTISGLTTIKELETPASTTPGSGSSCFYCSGFIGSNVGTLTINNLTFSGADISITTEGVANVGASSLAVVVGRNTGTLTLNNVNVNNSKVTGYTKIGALVGQQAGTITVNKCAVSGFTGNVKAIPSEIGGCNGAVFGYTSATGSNTVNGVKVGGVTWTTDPENGYSEYKTVDGCKYGKAGDKWYNIYCNTWPIRQPNNGGQQYVDIGDGMSTREPHAVLAASIDGYAYTSLAAAVEAADGKTITLMRDNVLSETVRTGTKDITIDLAGHSIMPNNAGLTLTGTTNDALIVVNYGGKLTVKDSEGNGKIFSNNIASVYSAIKMTEKGETYADKKATLVIDGGTIEGYYYGICGNGNRHGTDITINGGTITGEATGDFLGIYNPQNGAITVNGGTIIGQTGLAMKSGSLTITGGTIQGVGTKAAYVHNGNGFKSTGDALVVEACDYPGGLPVVVNISGGSFTSEHGEAVAYYQQSDSYKLANEQFITGGLFSTDPSEYLASGYKAFDDGISSYTYRVAKIPENVIKSANAVVVTSEDAATTEDAAAVIGTNKISVSGQISSTNKVIITYTNSDEKTGTITVTYVDGKFTASPATVTVGEKVYTVDVSGLTVLPAAIKIAPPAVKPPVAPTNPTDEETAAVNAIASGTEKINASGLGAAVASETLTTPDGLGDTLVTVGVNGTGVQQTTAEIIKDVLEDKDAPEIVNSASVDDLIVVVQPKLVIEVEGVVEDDGKKILKLDISAESQAIVTTKTLAGSNEALDNTNSVPVGTSVPVQIDTPVTLTIPVPAGFVGDDADNIFVDHTMHNGKIETVKATYDSQNNTITFTVKGMSPMNVKTDARTATIDYPDNASETYRADDVRELLPVAQKSGYRFVGWKFANVPNAAGTYLTMTDELLTALSENGNTVTAEPMFEQLPEGSSGVVHKIGAAAAEGNEVNPNTGAESAVGAAAAIAIVSLAAIVISKKK